jgi:hypothetical protein
MGWAIWVLVEGTETDEVVIPEQLNLFTGFLHKNILRRERVDIEDLPTTVLALLPITMNTPAELTLLNIFISSSVGHITSSHQVLSNSL